MNLHPLIKLSLFNFMARRNKVRFTYEKETNFKSLKTSLFIKF